MEVPALDRLYRKAIPELREALLAWYGHHRRDLPWRRTSDPYAIWVSEVMLQQTRVAAVLGHYARWMERFPTVQALAEAEEPEVLAYWSGLGYYRRARFLHAGARVVVAEHNGRLPRTAAGLKGLPGIGDYTAAAIASIAFGEAVAVLDGNVERVLLRLDGPAASQQLRIRAAALLSPDHPADHNQAMMELGATVCLPRAPLCLSCPLQPGCRTRGEHPVTPRKQPIARTLAYALVDRERSGAIEVLLVQRAASESLMPGMWELPPAGDFSRDSPITPVLTLHHAITVYNYTVHIYRYREQDAQGWEGTWSSVGTLDLLPLTGVARKVLRRLHLWPS